MEFTEKIDFERVKYFTVNMAKEAGAILLRHFGHIKNLEFKGEIDLLTEADTESEAYIISSIKKNYPDHSILAEESGAKESDSDFSWFVDPLDGTTNFAHGYPFFCTSICLAFKEEPVLGVILNPIARELFIAEKGGGATLNGNKIVVSKNDQVIRSLLITGFPYKLTEKADDNLNRLRKVISKAQAFRRDGSAALDLCYIASGRADGFWEPKLNAWDIAAGSLMVTEAGGKVSDYSGGPLDLYGNEILATNGLIHDQLIEILNS